MTAKAVETADDESGDCRLRKAVYCKVRDGRAVCPRCGALLAKLYYGAEAHGVELWCGRCKEPRILELDKTGKGR